jgi:hypothetical protein
MPSKNEANPEDWGYIVTFKGSDTDKEIEKVIKQLGTTCKKAKDSNGFSVMVPTLADAFMVKMGVNNAVGLVLEISNLMVQVSEL